MGSTRPHRSKEGISTVIGSIIVLGVILIATISIISLQIGYQGAAILRNQFEEDRKAENFIIDDSQVSGTSIRVTNLGTIQIRIVALYVNHACRWTENPVSGCTSRRGTSIDPENSQWISTGTGGLNPNNRITVTTARGNQAVVIFPVINTQNFGVGNNLYFGTGPLSIIFQNGSFNYAWWDTVAIPSKIQTKNAWSGIPIDSKYINPLFSVAIINHAKGNIILLQQSVLFVTPTSGTGGSGGGIRTWYMIVDNRSNVNSLVAYDQTARPYVIPQNETDLATGGTPVMVSFAATDAGTSNQQGTPNPNQLPITVAVFLGLVFIWNSHQYSENIPFATLRLCSSSPYPWDPSCNG